MYFDLMNTTMTSVDDVLYNPGLAYALKIAQEEQEYDEQLSVDSTLIPHTSGFTKKLFNVSLRQYYEFQSTR